MGLQLRCVTALYTEVVGCVLWRQLLTLLFRQLLPVWLPYSSSAYAVDGMMTYERFSGRAGHSQRKALLLTLLILLALAKARMQRTGTLLFS